jgi:hypothetical protein
MFVLFDYFCSIEPVFALFVLRIFKSALVRREKTLLRSALSIYSVVCVSKRIKLNEHVAYFNLRFKNELQSREPVPEMFLSGYVCVYIFIAVDHCPTETLVTFCVGYLDSTLKYGTTRNSPCSFRCLLKNHFMPYSTPLTTLRMATSCSTRLTQYLRNCAVDHGIP